MSLLIVCDYQRQHVSVCRGVSIRVSNVNSSVGGLILLWILLFHRENLLRTEDFFFFEEFSNGNSTTKVHVLCQHVQHLDWKFRFGMHFSFQSKFILSQKHFTPLPTPCCNGSRDAKVTSSLNPRSNCRAKLTVCACRSNDNVRWMKRAQRWRIRRRKKKRETIVTFELYEINSLIKCELFK